MPSPRSAPPSPSGRWSCLWQLAPEPIVCFDGDRAGEAAAARAIDRMLPNLREGRSFRFAFLPEGSDPDDLVRSKGARALAECLAGARPLIDVLWQRELKAHAIDTPERRAAFEERLETLLAEIGNARVKDHYRREVKNRLFNLWREQGARARQAAGERRRRAARGQSRRRRPSLRRAASSPSSPSRWSITLGCSTASPTRWRASRSGTRSSPRCSRP